MLTAFTSLYLCAHVVAAAVGWRAAAFLFVAIACALVVSCVLTAATKGGRR